MRDNLFQFAQQTIDNDFKVEFTTDLLFDSKTYETIRKKEIHNTINSLKRKQETIDAKIEELNTDIDRLTNHADGIDYTIAVSCGILCGILDSIFVGEFDYNGALGSSKERVNNFVKNKAEKVRTEETIKNAIAKAKEKAAAKGKELTNDEIHELKEKIKAQIRNTFDGYEKGDIENGTVNSLRRAIRKLENHYKISSDNMYKGIKGMNSESHHLDDLAHHPTLLGFCAALIGEFFKAGVFVDKNGSWHLIINKWDEEQKSKFINICFSIVIAAILRWLINSSTSKYKNEIDNKLPKPLANFLKSVSNVPMVLVILKKTVSIFDNWWGHLASDMAGSSSRPGAGMGIPGLFISIFKEISSIPPLNMTSLPKIVHSIYENQRFDMRTEMAVINELGKQSIPVLFGDILTRTIYFVRHLIIELKEKDNYKNIDWKNVIPFNNRTITRLLVIESGTFTACDVADAAIRSAIKNGGNIYNPKLYSDFILRVNFVGIGRFAIAVGSDINMDRDRKDNIKERIYLYNKSIAYSNAILIYKQEEVWITAKDTALAMMSLRETAYKSIIYYNDEIQKLDKEMEELNSYINELKKSNNDFANELLDILN